MPMLLVRQAVLADDQAIASLLCDVPIKSGLIGHQYRIDEKANQHWL